MTTCRPRRTDQQRLSSGSRTGFFHDKRTSKNRTELGYRTHRRVNGATRSDDAGWWLSVDNSPKNSRVTAVGSTSAASAQEAPGTTRHGLGALTLWGARSSQGPIFSCYLCGTRLYLRP